MELLQVLNTLKSSPILTHRFSLIDYIATKQPIVWRIPEGTTFEQAAAIGGIPVDVGAVYLCGIKSLLTEEI